MIRHTRDDLRECEICRGTPKLTKKLISPGAPNMALETGDQPRTSFFWQMLPGLPHMADIPSGR